MSNIMVKPYQRTSGFICDQAMDGKGIRRVPVAATTAIAKGDAIFDNGSGYGVNTTTAFSALFLGIAMHAVASQTSAGDADILVIPPELGYSYWVVNAGGSAAAQTDVGEVVDLEAANTVDVTDVTVTAAGWGFMVDEIDVSAQALAADGLGATVGGFVKGHFVRT